MPKGNGATAEAQAADHQQADVAAMVDKPVSITRDMLIGAGQRPMRTKDVVIPGFGRARVRALRANEREALDDAALVTEPKTGRVTSDYKLYKARALAMALVDPDTNAPLFNNPMGEAALLGDLEAVVQDQLFMAVDELSALTRKSQELLGKGLLTTGSTSS